jgi:acyl dehydratase
MSYATGDVIFEQSVPGADPARLTAFSAGTEDRNPIHLDEDFAKASGFPTLLQQGPMTTAHMARLLSEKVGQARMRWLDVSFQAPVFPGEGLIFKAVVTQIEDGMVSCAISAEKSDGTPTAKADVGFEI